MRTPVWCRNRAQALGCHVHELVSGLLGGGALHHLRAAQGVLSLADKHGAQRLDAACARATAAGDPSYRTVKGILIVAAETASPNPQGDGSASVGTPAHLHGPDGLFAHLDRDGSDAGDSELGEVGA